MVSLVVILTEHSKTLLLLFSINFLALVSKCTSCIITNDVALLSTCTILEWLQVDFDRWSEHYELFPVLANIMNYFLFGC